MKPSMICSIVLLVCAMVTLGDADQVLAVSPGAPGGQCSFETMDRKGEACPWILLLRICLRGWMKSN